jgi:hypothetical protein
MRDMVHCYTLGFVGFDRVRNFVEEQRWRVVDHSQL